MLLTLKYAAVIALVAYLVIPLYASRHCVPGYAVCFFVSVVTLRRARLVTGSVTVLGRVNRLGAEPSTRVNSADQTESSSMGRSSEYPATARGLIRHIA